MLLQQRCQPFDLILSDEDGAMIDGPWAVDSQGPQIKRVGIEHCPVTRLCQSRSRRFRPIATRDLQAVMRRTAERSAAPVSACKGARQTASHGVSPDARRGVGCQTMGPVLKTPGREDNVISPCSPQGRIANQRDHGRPINAHGARVPGTGPSR